MTAKMKALLAGGVATVIAGFFAIGYIPKPSTTRADLIDAGIVQDYTPRELACTLLLPDGGYAQRKPIVATAKVANADGSRDAIWNRADGLRVRPYVADENAGCRVLRTLTWGQVANFEDDAPDSPGDCACMPLDGGNPVCRRDDGGTWPVGWRNEMRPGEWSGGCVQKVCGEVFGRPNRPAGCRL